METVVSTSHDEQLSSDLHSKSPESDTTTVPVCLSRSSELDMMVDDRQERDRRSCWGSQIYNTRQQDDVRHHHLHTGVARASHDIISPSNAIWPSKDLGHRHRSQIICHRERSLVSGGVDLPPAPSSNEGGQILGDGPVITARQLARALNKMNGQPSQIGHSDMECSAITKG